MKIIKSLLVVAALSASVWALPPQIEADKLALGAKASLDAQDFKGALEKLEKLGSLNVKLPDSYWYYYGSTLVSLDRGQEAIAALDKYLEQGQKSKYYKEALQNYDLAEKSIKASAPFYDSATGLTWIDNKDTSVGKQKTWYEANDYCNNLTFASRSDWRLPTKDELLGLYNRRNSLKNIYCCANYWSSDEYVSVTTGSARAEYVDFSIGYLKSEDKSSSHQVRCVRR